MVTAADTRADAPRFPWALAAGTYAALLAAFWLVARRYDMAVRLGGHFPSAFVSFALLLAPYWAFGFGAADALALALGVARIEDPCRTGLGPAPECPASARRWQMWARVLLPGILLVPYLVFSLPRGEARAVYAVALFAIPVGLAALMEFLPPATDALCWQDVVALAVLGAPVEFRLLAGAWPHPGLSAMPKFLLLDAALYVYLVIRRLPRVGFDFRVRWRDLGVGLREFAFFAPIAIGLGLALHFLRPNFWKPGAGAIASAYAITFFFVGIPEELFFRGLLQNLLEARLGRGHALVLAACIFGLAHFNKPLPFNWRYVILAAIAGVFYGRAWLDRRRLTSSAITHATVDVVWGLWWR
jgi:membrane protease YdiL (CAAX protease family)